MKNKISFLCLSLLALLLFACDGKSENHGAGLQDINGLCTSSEQNNVSNQLRAEEAWSITIADNGDWLSVSPSSGTGSVNLINLIFNVQANNNAQSRSTEVEVLIGDTSYPYQFSQDGQTQKACPN